MNRSAKKSNLHTSREGPYEEVVILADAVGSSKITLAQVVQDFLKIVEHPLIAGGFAMAHHGCVRATVDIDVLAMESVARYVESFKKIGYKHESIRLPIGELELLSKGNKGVDFICLENAEFSSSISRRAVAGIFFGEKVSFVSLEDLILLKKLAIHGRRRKMDEADLENLLALKYDVKYVVKWSKRLGLD